MTLQTIINNTSHAKSIQEAFGIVFSSSRFAFNESDKKWFNQDYKIDELIFSFWGLKTKSKLIIACQELEDEFWRGLVADWDSKTNIPGQFRFSKSFVFNLLRLSLGSKDNDNQLSSLTKLELNIFENFFIELENFWQDYIQKDDSKVGGSSTYLVWQTEFENGEITSFTISVPSGLIPNYYYTENDLQIDHEHFIEELKLNISFDLTFGTTKLKISEIKCLEHDDLIIFENSNINQAWIDKEYDKTFINLEPPNRDSPEGSRIYYDDLQISDDMIDNEMVADSDDIFTDLSIELTAQFNSVSMPLKQMMELKAGNVLPLGLLLDSELVLKASGNKIVARGELVIIGNQFGLKIQDSRIKHKAHSNQPNLLGAPTSPQSAQYQPQQAQISEQHATNLDDDGLLGDLDQLDSTMDAGSDQLEQ